jgi:hypothetical protein
MQQILFDYKLNPTTWAYLSTLMIIGLYFKFHRFWSVRNLDLVALIALSPALLLIYYGLLGHRDDLTRSGYVWLFAVDGVFLVRLLLDPVMVRRPLLEPNLSASGLTFTGISLLVFLMANVIHSPPERLENLWVQQTAPVSPSPGYTLFYKFSSFSNQAIIPVDESQPELYRQTLRVAATHTAAILAHLIVVVGMVWIGFRHFDNIQTGVAAATLYLLTFYTSQFTSQVDHVAPAMLLVWAIAVYRRPLLAGVLLGLAAGMVYYPLFLLPLWCGFYWRRGVVRFAFGAIATLVLLAGFLAWSSPDWPSFVANLQQMVGWQNLLNVTPSGFWRSYDLAYRIPVMAAFCALCASLALWPAQKNLGTLLSCSAAVMLATQFWHVHQGGLYMGWYLPLLILTIFRPNLEDRVAISAVRPAWGWRKKG